MSENRDTSAENQHESHAKLQPDEVKEKLKDMGVMQDENTIPTKKASPFIKEKWLVLVVVVGVLVFWWWIASNGQPDIEQIRNEQTTSSVANNETATTSSSLPGGPTPGLLPGEVPPPDFQPRYDSMPTPPGNPPSATGSNGQWTQPPPGTMPPPNYPGYWPHPGNRGDDRFGLAPGWVPYGAAPPGYYYGPPAFSYYDRPLYGPPPGYYGPPPGYHGPLPPPGYISGY
jgi:hypothetical protein